MQAGAISQSDAALAQLVGRHCDTSLDRILRAEGLTSEQDLLKIHAKRLTTRTLSASELAETKPAITSLEPQKLLKYGILPFAEGKGRTAVAVSNPEEFRAVAPDLPIEIASANLVIGPRDTILETVAERHREVLTEAAQARVPTIESCRTWGNTFGRRLGMTITFLMGLVGLALAFPTIMLGAFVLAIIYLTKQPLIPI
ncbi:hypothetical protein [uncultured Roseovarius sp.]|uniref:hypothetical protein n=1 Tax=uncultured Roseovarius sp. TaxID=293344 RepID=UPI0026215D48|nr:hypothetical protein [uncultured Roseovarius sp.]